MKRDNYLIDVLMHQTTTKINNEEFNEIRVHIYTRYIDLITVFVNRSSIHQANIKVLLSIIYISLDKLKFFSLNSSIIYK